MKVRHDAFNEEQVENKLKPNPSFSQQQAQRHWSTVLQQVETSGQTQLRPGLSWYIVSLYNVGLSCCLVSHIDTDLHEMPSGVTKHWYLMTREWDQAVFILFALIGADVNPSI